MVVRGGTGGCMGCSEGRNMCRETLSAEPRLMCAHACLHTQGTCADYSD